MREAGPPQPWQPRRSRTGLSPAIARDSVARCLRRLYRGAMLTLNRDLPAAELEAALKTAPPTIRARALRRYRQKGAEDWERRVYALEGWAVVGRAAALPGPGPCDWNPVNERWPVCEAAREGKIRGALETRARRRVAHDTQRARAPGTGRARSPSCPSSSSITGWTRPTRFARSAVVSCTSGRGRPRTRKKEPLRLTLEARNTGRCDVVLPHRVSQACRHRAQGLPPPRNARRATR
jgi:hypothetical protein